MKIEIPTIEPNFLDSFQINEIDGKLKSVRLGREAYPLRFLREERSMRSMGIKIKMYVIKDQGNRNFIDHSLDLADIVITGGRTPVQKFVSKRVFGEIPIDGVADFIAQSPDKQVYTGRYDSKFSKNNVVFIGEGWVFCWVVPKGEVFRFLELCSPRFIDETLDIPKGELGIEEISNLNDYDELQDEFKRIYIDLTS